MTARRSFALQLVALGLSIATSLLALPFLGGTVPTHWGASGAPDSWGSPAFALLLGPALLAGTVAVSAFLVGRPNVSREALAGMTVVAGFFLGEHGLTLGATLFRTFFPVRPLLALVFGVFIGLAPILARVEPNPWFGVRTPWTMGSRRVWKATHRATGRLWLVGAALTIVGLPLPLVVGYLVLLALAPVAISYRVWKGMGRP